MDLLQVSPAHPRPSDEHRVLVLDCLLPHQKAVASRFFHAFPVAHYENVTNRTDDLMHGMLFQTLISSPGAPVSGWRNIGFNVGYTMRR